MIDSCPQGCPSAWSSAGLPRLQCDRAPRVYQQQRGANRSRLTGGNMATTQSSSPFHSPQITARKKPAPANGTSLVEQQLRLSVESPQLLAAIEILLPLAKTVHGELSAPRSSSCRPKT